MQHTPLPIEMHVKEGSAELFQTANSLEIRTGNFAHLNWDEFSIETNETVRFLQPSKSAVAINQVMHSEPSRLLGALESTGQVVLVNPNGILVGENAVIDTGSFIASTLDLIANSNKSLHFSGSGSFSNRGMICAEKTIILSRRIENLGEIQSSGGIQLGACESVTLNFENFDWIINDGAAKDEIGIDVRGKLISSSILLEAPSSTIALNGTLVGDRIHILGSANHLYSSTYIDVSSDTDAGVVLIGGDIRGDNPQVRNSKHTWISEGVRIRANSLSSGNGGKIILWGDASTSFYGDIEAKGGPLGGDGGFVEISSRGVLQPNGAVSTEALMGRAGTLLFDPCTVTISTAADSGLSAAPPPYSFSGATSNINIATLNGLLATNNVTIDASASGTSMSAGSITLNADADSGAPIMWDSGITPTKLTLIADGFIQIFNVISSLSTAASATTPVIEVNAPIVDIGDVALANLVSLTSVSGRIDVYAPTRLTMWSSLTADDSGIYAGTGGQGDVFIQSGPFAMQCVVRNFAIESPTQIDMDINGAIELLAGISGGASDASAIIQGTTTSSTVNLVGTSHLTLIGGSGTLDSEAGIFSQGGDVSVRIAQDFIFRPGTNTSTSGSCAIGVTSPAPDPDPGSLIIEGRNFYLTRGPVPAGGINLAGIGIFGNATGTVNVTATGTDGIVCTAQNGHSALINSSFSLGTPSGDITINTTAFTMNGSTTATGSGSIAGVLARGDVTVNATDRIIAIGGSGDTNVSAGILTSSGSITIRAPSIDLFGGSSSSATAFISSNDSFVDIELTGDLYMQSGSASQSFAGIAAAGNAGAGYINVTASNITVVGGTGPNAFSTIVAGQPGFPGGSVNVVSNGSQGITLNGGDGLGSRAVIGAEGDLLSNTLSIRCTNPSANLNLMSGTNSAAEVTNLGGGPIDILVGNNLNMTSTPGFDALISIGPGGNSNLTVQVGNSTFINSTIQNLGSGDIIFAVDGDFPAPFLGNGSFNLGPSATLTSGSAIRIFTSRQDLNDIQGLLNGFSFTPGTRFVDTNQEIWCVYFPSNQAGNPFTIFYKECVQLLASQSEIIVAESLVDLHPFNEFPGWWKRFTLSSEEFVTPYFITVRQQGLFWNPKTYTAFLHDLLELN